MNKYKFFGVITSTAVFITIVGSWMKITHQHYADFILTIGMFGEAIGIPVLIWFLFEWLREKTKR